MDLKLQVALTGLNFIVVSVFYKQKAPNGATYCSIGAFCL